MTPAALLLTVLLTASVPSSGESEPAWETRVLWHRGEEGRAAFFLPQRALDGPALEELPVGTEGRAMLRQAFRLDGQPEWPPVVRDESSPGAADGPPECYELVRWGCSTGDPRMTAMLLRSRVRDQQMSFVGRAIAVVPGLLPDTASAVDMVYLEVAEVLRDETGLLASGQVLGMVQHGGRVTVGGLPLCSFRHRPDEAVRPGDRVLVGGKLSEKTELVIEPIFRFHVEDGLIQPSSFANVLDALPMPLAELAESLETGAAMSRAADTLTRHDTPPAAGDPAYLDSILWSRQAPEEALFLPRTVLESTPLEELPLGKERQQNLLRLLGFLPPVSDAPALLRRYDRRHWVAAKREKHEAPIRDCEVPRFDFREKERSIEELPAPLLEKLERAEVAFVGEVVAVVPGWTFAPVEMVYVRVDEVVRDRSGKVAAGIVMHNTRRAGEVVISGQTLCSERDPWEIVTRPGDVVLVGGRLAHEYYSDQLTDRFELLVRDGLIQPRAASPVSDRLPMSLAEVIEAFRAAP